MSIHYKTCHAHTHVPHDQASVLSNETMYFKTSFWVHSCKTTARLVSIITWCRCPSIKLTPPWLGQFNILSTNLMAYTLQQAIASIQTIQLGNHIHSSWWVTTVPLSVQSLYLFLVAIITVIVYDYSKWNIYQVTWIPHIEQMWNITIYQSLHSQWR